MRKVSHARFQTNLFLPGLGEIGNVLPSYTKTFSGLDMTTSPDGLVIKFNVPSTKAQKEVLVPFANIVFMELSGEITENKKHVIIAKTSG
jgi:hypothetical protein